MTFSPLILICSASLHIFKEEEKWISSANESHTADKNDHEVYVSVCTESSWMLLMKESENMPPQKTGSPFWGFNPYKGTPLCILLLPLTDTRIAAVAQCWTGTLPKILIVGVPTCHLPSVNAWWCPKPASLLLMLITHRNPNAVLPQSFTNTQYS